MITTVEIEEGAEPTPVVESLDGVVVSEESVPDTQTLLRDLQAELMTVQNDPDKALELRRRIQLLQTQKEASFIPAEEAPQE